MSNINNKHRKRCPTSRITREIQIKTSTRYLFTPTRTATIKTQKIVRAARERGSLGS